MKDFNLVVTGVGGQGIITLSNIIVEAALKQGYDVKMSELHGLAQRGGHIECHIRLGKKVYSSLVEEGDADLIIALEPLESLRACHYASKENNTTFLINSYRIMPLSVFVSDQKYPSIQVIVKNLKRFSNEVIVVDASNIVKKETGSMVATNIYMLGYASSRNLIPVEKKFLLQSIKENIPEKYFEMNKKIFELAQQKS